MGFSVVDAVVLHFQVDNGFVRGGAGGDYSGAEICISCSPCSAGVEQGLSGWMPLKPGTFQPIYDLDDKLNFFALLPLPDPNPKKK